MQALAPKSKGAVMPECDDQGLDAARRMTLLFSLGVHSEVFISAIERSCDVQDLRQILGFIEDLLDKGCVIKDPE